LELTSNTAANVIFFAQMCVYYICFYALAIANIYF
jgi:hypothetical protein